MTRKALLSASIACGLILAGLAWRDGALLALATPFIVYLVIGIVLVPGKIELQAVRKLDKSCVSLGEPLEVRIAVVNQGNSSVTLCLEDVVQTAMEGIGERARQRLLLRAGETREMHHTFRASRGLYSWTALRVRASDPFGLFETAQDVPAPGQVLVRPAALRVRRVQFRPRSTVHTAGPIPARLGGAGTDFLGVREYRLGDSLRRLNWRLAGRHPGRLFTNEYEREEIGDFGLILDARRLTSARGVEQALFEHAVSAASSLAETLLRDGNRVALLVFGATLKALYPGYGKRQLSRILATLSSAAQGPSLSFGFLEYFPVRLFPTRSTIVLFSSVSARDLPTYARLRSFGYDIVLISPDPIEYIAERRRPTGISPLAVRAARVERFVMLEHLLRMGVVVLNWNVSRQIGELLEHAESRLNPQRGVRV